MQYQYMRIPLENSVKKRASAGVVPVRTQRQFYSPSGELYCFAVIFVLRQVILPSAVYRRIKYHCNRKVAIKLLQSNNITPTQVGIKLENIFICIYNKF